MIRNAGNGRALLEANLGILGVILDEVGSVVEDVGREGVDILLGDSVVDDDDGVDTDGDDIIGLTSVGAKQE